LTSGVGAVFDDLLFALGSDFLFVTGAFNCAETGFAAVLDKDFSVALVAVLVLALEAVLSAGPGPGLAIVLIDVLLFDCTAVSLEATLALPADLSAVFTTGFAAVFDSACLAGANFAFFAEDVWFFAGFFIAFAMESTTK
jgi:hypothetical protein